jgi:MFS family permease
LVLAERIQPARLGALNFGIQFVWGAILAVSLQARSIELGHGSGVGAYAVIASAGAALAAIVQVIAGRLADRRRAQIGHRREFYWFCVAAIPALVWFFVAPSFAQLLAAFLALQIVLNVASGPYQAAIPDHAPARRQGELSSWMSGYQSLGNAAGLLVAGFVHDNARVAGILSAGLAASFAPTITHLRTLQSRPVVAQGVRLDAPLAIMLLSRGLVNLGFYTLMGFLLFFVRDSLGIAGLDAQRMQTALLFLSFTLAAIAGAVAAARPADRYDKRAVVTAANALIVVCSAQQVGVAYGAAIAAGAAWGAFATSDWALACVLLPRGAMAAAMGVWNVATAVPQIVAPLVGGYIVVSLNAAHAGLGPRAVIVFSLLAFAAGTAVIWRLPRSVLAAQE